MQILLTPLRSINLRSFAFEAESHVDRSITDPLAL
jgi:dTDP-D-glucose 4,6-dehydratase